MKIAVIGSRRITEVDLERYVTGCDEIVSGGAAGVDSCAAEYARENGLKLTEFLPQYEHYGRAAPIKRNKEIVEYLYLYNNCPYIFSSNGIQQKKRRAESR